MIDARAAHHRYDEHNERFPGKHGRHDRKIRSTFTRQSSRYAPYEKKKQHSWRIKDHSKTREDVNMKRIAPYVSIPRTGDIGGSSTQQSDGVMMQDTQQSSGKRIASLMVTPSRHALDDNVAKRPTVSPRLLTFSHGGSITGRCSDARAAHHRYDEHNERFPGKHGRHDRKIRSTFTRQSSRYAPYEKKKQHSWRIKDHSKTREDVNMKRIAPYVSIPRTGDIGGSSTQQSDGVMMQDTQQSSGKRIASLMEVLPVDAQVIGALNDMEITSNSAERLNDADKSEGGNEDDLLGEDLMDMKADIVKLTERDAGNDKEKTLRLDVLLKR
ncbi:hypothetical protein Bca52824_073866 [Brassica carinata]|uniref:Uncharacterized protein n=1 Tax=Brassica carinata TaxID=52824 RepID=A0A8X7QCE7_BRACI|nr:hypothetical protein Bca52824_073866 [Brassica carinata]